jgi:ribonucleoside-diphosphate reductase alpha chain
VGEVGEISNLRATDAGPHQELPFLPITLDAPLCSECGSIMMRDGSCYNCGNCGVSSGCS